MVRRRLWVLRGEARRGEARRGEARRGEVGDKTLSSLGRFKPFRIGPEDLPDLARETLPGLLVVFLGPGPTGLDAARVGSATSTLLWIRLLCPLCPDPEEFAAFATDPRTRVVPLVALEKRVMEGLATPVRLHPGRFSPLDRHACDEEDCARIREEFPRLPSFREKALVAATGLYRKEIQRATLRCFGRWPGYLLAAWRRAVRRAEERAGWSEEEVRDSLGYRTNATLRRAIRLGQA